jgi:hypothetical protein
MVDGLSTGATLPEWTLAHSHSKLLWQNETGSRRSIHARPDDTGQSVLVDSSWAWIGSRFSLISPPHLCWLFNQLVSPEWSCRTI